MLRLLPYVACLLAGLCAFNLGTLLLQLIATRRQSRALQGRVARLGSAGQRCHESYQDFPELALLLELVHASELDEARGEHDGRDGDGRIPLITEGHPRPGRRGADGDAGRVQDDRKLLLHAGLEERIRPETLGKLRRFCSGVGAALCATAGLLVSSTLAPIGLLLGAFLGYRWPTHVLEQTVERRKALYERDLPFMLDIISLCVQTGMSFDAAFGMFCQRFDSALAHDCEQAYLCYLQGAETREESLERLAIELDLVSFDRFVEVVTQALRFGAPLASVVAELSEEIRKEYRARISEYIAKAPVRMLIPTGTLILPAMLLLVLGPVVLNIVGEML